MQPSMVGPAAPLRHRSGLDEAGAPAASAEGIVAVRRHLGGAGGAVGAVGVSGAAAYAYAHGAVGVSGAADPSESLSLAPSLSLSLSLSLSISLSLPLSYPAPSLANKAGVLTAAGIRGNFLLVLGNAIVGLYKTN